ncbi:MAG: translation initiation factor IF-3 [Candidatus Cloacimonetes bacterium]|nr:translation initiation factor IF-3 [Candidatus Cloacimonadota bacterium]
MSWRGRGKSKKKPEVAKEKVNNQIRTPRVRLISETGDQVGVVSLAEAMSYAERAGLDLVEVSPNASPPVCKILDFGQYYYQKTKDMRESRKNQHVVQTKEVKFGPNTEEHDYGFKKDHAVKFLSQHNKVKLTVRFRGRQLAHKDLGFNLLERLLAELASLVVVEVKPRNEGRTVFTIISPKKDIDKILETWEYSSTVEEEQEQE